MWRRLFRLAAGIIRKAHARARDVVCGQVRGTRAGCGWQVASIKVLCQRGGGDVAAVPDFGITAAVLLTGAPAKIFLTH